MSINFFCTLILTLFLTLNKPEALVAQVFFHLATGNEPELVESSDFSKLADEASKAVVNIQIEGSKNIYFSNSLFQNPFQMIEPKSVETLQKIISTGGSAVIINENGYLITSRNLVNNSNKINVSLPDRSKYEANVVACYPEIDLAILKISNLQDKKLPYLKIGSLKNIKLGTFVAGLGNTSNFGKTFSHGNITATKQSLNKPNIEFTFSVLFHDAAVSIDNIGGALVDRYGNLIGINNVLITHSSPINFAIPVDVICDYLNKFFYKIDGCWFGLNDVKSVSSISLNFSPESSFTYDGGLLVTDITDKTPVKVAGLLSNDIILSIGGVFIKTLDDLRIREAVLEPDKDVDMLVWRDGKTITLNVKPTSRPKQAVNEPIIIQGKHPLNGVQVIPLDPTLAEKMRLPTAAKGLLVLNDVPNIDSARSPGLFRIESFIKKHDVIVNVNGEPTQTIDDLNRILNRSTLNKTFSIHLQRNGQEIQFSLNGFDNIPEGQSYNMYGDDGHHNEQLPQLYEQPSQLHDSLKEIFDGLLSKQGIPKVPDKSDVHELLKDVPSQMA